MFKIKLKPPVEEKTIGSSIKQEVPSVKVKKPSIKIKVSKPSKYSGNASSSSTANSSLVKKVPRIIRVKPTRIPGDGYDSEASDAEDDPWIEEAVIIRFFPDAELDYVRHCVETGEFKNFYIKWKDRVRAIIHINNSIYGAKLINLPNLIEAQKTIDKKNLFKTADISQILLVVKRLNDESEINDIKVEDKEILEDGITPPLKNIVNSQYRRKMDYSTISKIEAKVDELLRLDEEAEDTQFQFIDPEAESITSSLSPSMDINFSSEFPNDFNSNRPLSKSDSINDILGGGENHVDDLELELEQALGEEELGIDQPEQNEEEDIIGGAEDEEDEDEEDEDDDDEDDDDDDDTDNENGVSRKVEVDEDEQHNALLRDEITELESTIEQNKERLSKTHNPLLQSRFIDSIKKLEKELENKKRQLKTGEDKTNSKNNQRKEEEDDDEDNANASDGDQAGLFDDEDEDDEEEEDDPNENENENENDNQNDNGNDNEIEQVGASLEEDDGDLDDLFE